MKNLHKYFVDLKFKVIFVSYLFVFMLGFMSYSTYSDYTNQISLAEKFENQLNTAFKDVYGDVEFIENDEHVLGVVLNSTETLNLYHPAIWFIIFLLFTTYVVMMNIAYVQQKKNKRVN